MADPRYTKHAGGVFFLRYHFVWCPKYRRPVLVGQIAKDLEALLREKAEQLQVVIEALTVQPGYVHLFVAVDPTEAPQRLANQFKGYTSRILRQRYPALKSRLPNLWSRSYYVGSIGHVSDKTVRQYIEAQQRS